MSPPEKSVKPDYEKAYRFFKKSLELQIGKATKEEVSFKLGRCAELAKKWNEAVTEYQSYLKEFGKDGKHAKRVRFNFAQCHVRVGRQQEPSGLLGLLRQNEYPGVLACWRKKMEEAPRKAAKPRSQEANKPRSAGVGGTVICASAGKYADLPNPASDDLGELDSLVRSSLSSTRGQWCLVRPFFDLAGLPI